MADGKATGKYSKRRSRLGVFVGFSQNHAGTVPLIYNPSTKHVSPQYHIVWDKDFSIAPTSHLASTKSKIHQIISDLFSNSEWRYEDEYYCDKNDETTGNNHSADGILHSRSDFYFDNNKIKV